MANNARHIILVALFILGIALTFYGAFHTRNTYKTEALTSPMTSPITPTLCMYYYAGDTDCNGVIELKDFEILRKEYTKEVVTKRADFNVDGAVNLIDFEIWRKGYFLR